MPPLSVADPHTLFRSVITEEDQREETLRERERRLVEVEDVANVGSFDWDPLTGRIVWSDQMYRIYSVARDELEPTIDAFLERVHPDDRKGVEGFLERQLASDRDENHTFRLIRPDGSVRHVHARGRVVRDAKGRTLRVVGTNQDVTESWKATETLRENEERLRSVWESTKEAIVYANSAGRIVSWNPAAERLFGYSADEATGQPLTLLMPERFHADHIAGLARFWATGETRVIGKTVDLVGKTKDGSEFPLELSLDAAKTTAGTFFTGVIRDVTEKKMIEQIRTDFVAMLTHDLKNPIGILLSFTDFLEEADAEDQRAILTTLKGAANRALTIVNNFLDYTRIENGSLKIFPENVSLNEIVRDVVDSQRGVARRRKVVLETDLADDLPKLMLDPQLFGRAVTNLVGNAIKFSPQGGRVSVETAREGGRVRLTVRDEGPGITPADRENLFQRFVFLSGRRKDSTGLGLFIVKSVVDAHGGEVGIECPPEAGAVFRVSLPELSADPRASSPHG